MKRIALVTGASSGVGRAFVCQLDRGGGGPLDEIWAVARGRQDLEELAATCAHTTVRVVSLDLMDQNSLDSLGRLLQEEDVRVEWLVNSAGFGTFGTYDKVGRAGNASMVRLNCLALTEVISLALPHMGAGSRIINLASIAGAVPQVELATYSATKAYVLELSQMLNHELRPAGIAVTAVCPKFMRTRFLDKPGDEEAARRMTLIGFEDVDVVVRKAMRAALHGRGLCIPSMDMRVAHATARVLPRKALFLIEDVLFGRR